MRVCVCTRASLLVCIYIYDFIMCVYVCVSVYACACHSLCEMSEYASVRVCSWECSRMYVGEFGRSCNAVHGALII